VSRPGRGGRRSSLRRSLGAIALDVTPLRESRDFRLLMLGQLVSGLGTQIALVALPYQIFVLSHSAALVGLLGAFELGPMIVASLLGGAIADRLDRRRVLIGSQFAIIATAALLLRGRMSAFYSLVVTGGPRLGDIESGLVAGATSAATSLLTGGLACIVGAATVVVAFPALARYDSQREVSEAGTAT